MQHCTLVQVLKTQILKYVFKWGHVHMTSLFLYQAISHQCVLVCARFRSAWPARSCHRETGFGGTFFWLNAAGLVVVSLL